MGLMIEQLSHRIGLVAEQWTDYTVLDDHQRQHLQDGQQTFVVNTQMNIYGRTYFKWLVSLRMLKVSGNINVWCETQWGPSMFDPVVIRDSYHGPDSIYHHDAKWLQTFDYLYLRSDEELFLFKLTWS